MPIQVTWFDETQRIIVLHYSTRWSWSEHYEAVAQCHQMQDTIEYPIGLVLDMHESYGLPSLPLEHLQGMSKLRHPRTTIKVMVGANNFIRSIIRIVQRLSSIHRTIEFIQVDTLDEARQVVMARLNQTEV